MLVGLVAVPIVAASITLEDKRTRVPSALMTSTPGLLRGVDGPVEAAPPESVTLAPQGTENLIGLEIAGILLGPVRDEQRETGS